MAKNIDTIASQLGARVITDMPEVGPGAFGVARLAAIVQQLRSCLIPSRGRRTGRPTNAKWVRHPKVPMSHATEQRLARLAAQASTGDRKISPMQLAAQILESAVNGLTSR